MKALMMMTSKRSFSRQSASSSMRGKYIVGMEDIHKAKDKEVVLVGAG
jgi:hypothetical protein